jgi:hypothetical protein
MILGASSGKGRYGALRLRGARIIPILANIVAGGHAALQRFCVMAEVVEKLRASLKREDVRERSNGSLTAMPLSQLHFMFM